MVSVSLLLVTAIPDSTLVNGEKAFREILLVSC